MAPDGYRLGIDFGTSNTVAALADPDGRVRPLLFDGSPLLGSAVFAGPGTGLLVGADAARAAVGYPAGMEPNPKRRIDDGTVWLGERDHPVVDVIAAVLDRVYQEASRVAGQVVGDVALTHPSTWGRVRLGVLDQAAQRIGIETLTFVPEPVAAAAYFATILGQRIPAERCIVIYDLGAGTFDVSIVRPAADSFEVVASDGLADVGGLDLDAVVVRHARQLTGSAEAAWQRLNWPQSAGDQQARHMLWTSARAVKEQLTRHAAGDLHLPLVDERVHLTREEFEKAARVHLERTATLTLTMLQRSGVAPEEIAGVFLVGGSSRIPLAATLLHRTLRIAPTVLDQPELVVAEGALYSRATPAAALAGAHAEPAIAEPAIADPAIADPATEPVIAGPAAAALRVNAVEPAPSSAPRARRRLPAGGRGHRRTSIVIAVIAVIAVVAGGLFAASRPWSGPWLGPPFTSVALTGAPLTDGTNTFAGVAISGDGKTIASADGNATVSLWDVPAHRSIDGMLAVPVDSYYAVAFSPDGKTLATAGLNGTIRLWDVASRTPRGDPLTGHTDSVVGLAFSPDGRTLASASWDKTVRLWDADSGRPRGAPLIGHTAAVTSVAFSPDGKTIASAGYDGTIRLWDVRTHAQVGTPLAGHGRAVRAVAFSPDGRTLASGGDDETVRLWDASTRESIGAPLKGHLGPVNAVAFSPDGTTVASAGDDRTIRLWDVAHRKAAGAAVPGHTGSIKGLAFSHDGKLIVTGGRDGTVRLWLPLR